MLVLSRRESEKIFFPDLGISLEIVRVKGNTVRVGIDAPQEVRVLRGELLDKNPNQCADGYSGKFGGEPAVRESKNGYHISRNPIDLAVDPAHDMIAC
jgi:carbon storage regulator CsrA